MDRDIVFRSKIGLVSHLPFIIAAAFTIISVYDGQVLAGTLFFTVFALFMLSFLNTAYIITPNNLLKVKCSFFIRLQFDINSIKKIETSKSVMSSPALSLDRMVLFYGKYDSVIISPKQKEEFVAQLKTINPAIEVDNL